MNIILYTKLELSFFTFSCLYDNEQLGIIRDFTKEKEIDQKYYSDFVLLNINIILEWEKVDLLDLEL